MVAVVQCVRCVVGCVVYTALLSVCLLHHTTRCVRASTSWRSTGALSRRSTASRRQQTPSRWVLPGVGKKGKTFSVGKQKTKGVC